MRKKDIRLFVIEKEVFACSLKEALKLEKKSVVTRLYEKGKEPESTPGIGFRRDD